jgi:hypothetical protein
MGNMNYKSLILPGVSLALVGMGVSIAIEAGFWKWNGKSAWEWILLGTLGLAVLNSGLSLFGEAVRRSITEKGKSD